MIFHRYVLLLYLVFCFYLQFFISYRKCILVYINNFVIYDHKSQSFALFTFVSSAVHCTAYTVWYRRNDKGNDNFRYFVFHYGRKIQVFGPVRRINNVTGSACIDSRRTWLVNSRPLNPNFWLGTTQLFRTILL